MNAKGAFTLREVAKEILILNPQVSSKPWMMKIFTKADLIK
jgi:hypothetical protein